MGKKKVQNRAWLLVDRSGSMGTRWVEAIGGLNAFVEKVPADTHVVLDMFDAHQADWYVRVQDVVQSKFLPLTTTGIQPRGGTALNDAPGRLLSEVLATEGKHVVVITTDGEENASREFNHSSVKTLLKQAEDAGVEIVWLGADFSQVEEQSRGLGFAAAKTMNMSAGNMADSYRGIADKATLFYSTGAAMSFTDAEKAAASTVKKKPEDTAAYANVI